VTHDQKEALSISDRMAILEGGKIAQIGAPEDVYRRPHSRVVADFIGETDFIPGKVIAVEGDFATVETVIGSFDGLIGDVNAKPSVGAAVTLSVRPEAWTITEKSAPLNSVKGRIGDAIYLGEVAQYEFLAGGNHALKIFELNPRLSARPADRDLYASATKEDVVVLSK
jgi:iron(III) transport system ATP-binding protein